MPKAMTAVHAAITCAVVAIVASCASGGVSRLWEALPHSISCAINQSDCAVNPPVRVEQVTLPHPGGQRLDVALDFTQGAPV